MDQTDSQFTFSGFDEDIMHGLVRFRYGLSHGDDTYHFTETLSFLPPVSIRYKTIPQGIITGILESLHLLLGISYWKTFCPKRIIIENNTLDRDQAEFWNVLYTKGLGEFYFKNSLDFRGLVEFPFITPAKSFAKTDSHLSTQDRALVLLGAGKDSIVSAELLKKYKKDFSLFSLNEWPVIGEAAREIGASLISIHRSIDPQLFEVNKLQGALNGHIPITAMFSLTGMLAAILYGYRYVIASNEESASYGNVKYLGMEINHQWSKSYEFEKLLQEYSSRFITPDIQYFSLLRPLTELNITKIFATHDKYFHIFTSCNKNFLLRDRSKKSLWCGECPKCAFIFLLLSAFLSKNEVVGIFHQNLLANERLLPIYKELLGLEGFKPFECVGTPEESLFAFVRVVHRGEFKNDVVVRLLTAESQKVYEQKQISSHAVMSVSKNHRIPEEFVEIVANL